MKPLNEMLGRRRLTRVRPPVPSVAKIAISAEPVFGPWGGGNQWLLQVARYLNYSGYEVRYDLDSSDIDCIFIQHNGLTGKMTFGYNEIAEYKEKNPNVRIIHRINDNDIRKRTEEMDALMSVFNKLADFTIFISEWLLDYHAELWFDRSKPHLSIINGADPSVYHPIGSPTWDGEEPFRLITHHWADNPMKGFAHYAMIDDAIAAGTLTGVELWVVGRWPRDLTWKTAQTFPPANGPDLGHLLRQCHGYVTASLWEPGGMHFIEGLQCGLPIAFHEDGGGIPEVASQYGVSFRDDPAGAVRALMADYKTHRQNTLLYPPSGDGMCLAYREVLQYVLAMR
jgi:glycosyltransferase involved in cell wall biosynthesis